jgi:hypothetical protein
MAGTIGLVFSQWGAGNPSGAGLSIPTGTDSLTVAVVDAYCESSLAPPNLLVERNGLYLEIYGSGAGEDRLSVRKMTGNFVLARNPGGGWEPLQFRDGALGTSSTIEQAVAAARLVAERRAREAEAAAAEAARIEKERRARQAAADSIAAAKERAEAARQARAQQREAERRKAAAAARYRKQGWSERAIAAVLGRKIYLGMTKEMVRASWGLPDDINRTITVAGVHEQWVYGDSYVYFDDGRLTAIQD